MSQCYSKEVLYWLLYLPSHPVHVCIQITAQGESRPRLWSMIWAFPALAVISASSWEAKVALSWSLTTDAFFFFFCKVFCLFLSSSCLIVEKKSNDLFLCCPWCVSTWQRLAGFVYLLARISQHKKHMAFGSKSIPVAWVNPCWRWSSQRLGIIVLYEPNEMWHKQK